MTSLAAFLQAPEPETKTKPVVGGLTILDLLREGKMEAGGSVSRIRQRKSFTQRLGLKGMSCCGGPIWGFQADTISIVDDDEVEGDVFVSRGGGGGGHEIRRPLTQDEDVAVEQEELVCAAELPASASSSSMNLAAALAAERQYRATQEPETVSEEGMPLRVSLMRLLEEGDGWPGEAEAAEGSDGDVCCVCMGRKKGAAFIPCGHTYCRVCSRELWLNRGSCPLCNRRIIEILDIF